MNLINSPYYQFWAGVMLYLHWCELNAVDEDRGVENASPPPLVEPAKSLLICTVPDEQQRAKLLDVAFNVWFKNSDWYVTISTLMDYVQLQVMIGWLEVCG